MPDAPAAGSSAHVRSLFLRLLGLVFLVAFLSLLVQLPVLFGERGLLPARAYLDAVRASGGGLLSTPTMFWIECGESTLRLTAIAGAVVSFGLILNVAPAVALAALWMLYLSFVAIGQDFLSFQWDNLLLESAFFSFFIVRGGPHPIGIFLMRWLLFRLNVESGAAKLLGGDPTWRDLTALVSYYETAPLPTPLGWWAHQMPVWAHQLSAGFTYVVELGGALLMWGPRPLRLATLFAMVGMQLSILLTANYGFFNYLSLALCLFLLDDRDLASAARRLGWTLPPTPPRHSSPLRTALLAATATILVLLSIVPFLPWLGVPPAVTRAAAPVQPLLRSVRSINAYHLFAYMTLVRREVVIEGSDDGTTWLPYEFRYKPGDPLRAPPTVAPHQPRVDFQLWFLLLGGRTSAPYFETLLRRIFEDPDAVAPLFAHAPFAGRGPPKLVRLAIYRYRFTDHERGRATGAWWSRELLGYSRVLDAKAFPRS